MADQIDYAKWLADGAAVIKGLESREEALRAGTARDIEQLIAVAASLDPETKVRLILAMGFTPRGDRHDADCDSRLGSGMRCNCVPPATWWLQPKDVSEFRKETWKDRVELARTWSREGSHGREKREN